MYVFLLQDTKSQFILEFSNMEIRFSNLKLYIHVYIQGV